jgi:hypothetical protein
VVLWFAWFKDSADFGFDFLIGGLPSQLLLQLGVNAVRLWVDDIDGDFHGFFSVMVNAPSRWHLCPVAAMTAAG